MQFVPFDASKKSEDKFIWVGADPDSLRVIVSNSTKDNLYLYQFLLSTK